MILDKSKTHTIRRRRKRPTKAKDTLMLYTGMRTKNCELICVTECVKVEPIEIIMKTNNRRIVSPIYVDGKQFWKAWDVQEVHRLATGDGFINIPDFFKFFERYKQDVLEDFEIIHWNPYLMVVNGNGKAGEVRLLGDKSSDVRHGISANIMIFDDPFRSRGDVEKAMKELFEKPITPSAFGTSPILEDRQNGGGKAGA